MTTDWPFYSTSWEAADAPPPPPDLDLSRLFWSLPDPSLASHRWRQVLVLYNPPAARLKGYHGDEIIGQHFSRFYRPRTSRPASVKSTDNRNLQQGEKSRCLCKPSMPKMVLRIVT